VLLAMILLASLDIIITGNPNLNTISYVCLRVNPHILLYVVEHQCNMCVVHYIIVDITDMVISTT
jgi:hypothetical protein